MSIRLKKGNRINLSKEGNGLNRILLGLGWDANDSDTGTDFDLDVSVFMLAENGRVPEDDYFVFYNNLQSPDGSVVHQGDNRTGYSDNSDDETISIDFSKMSSKIQELVIVVTIDEAIDRGQNFGQVSNSFIRLYNLDTKEEVAKFELDEEFSREVAVEFGRIYRKGNIWKFKAVGMGSNLGLESFVNKFV